MNVKTFIVCVHPIIKACVFIPFYLSATKRDVTPVLKVSVRSAGKILSTDSQTEVWLISCRAITSHLCTALLLPAALSSTPLRVPSVIFYPETHCVLRTPMSELPVGFNNSPTSQHFVSNQPWFETSVTFTVLVAITVKVWVLLTPVAGKWS